MADSDSDETTSEISRLDELAAAVDTFYLLFCGALVFFMQAGFGSEFPRTPPPPRPFASSSLSRTYVTVQCLRLERCVQRTPRISCSRICSMRVSALPFGGPLAMGSRYDLAAHV